MGEACMAFSTCIFSCQISNAFIFIATLFALTLPRAVVLQSPIVVCAWFHVFWVSAPANLKPPPGFDPYSHEKLLHQHNSAAPAHHPREEELYDVEEVLGRDVSSVFPQEAKKAKEANMDQVQVAGGDTLLGCYCVPFCMFPFPWVEKR